MQWTLANIIRAQARARGDHPMITCGPRRLTYEEVYARSCRVAEALAQEGVGPQDRVAFLDKNGPEYFEVLFGGRSRQRRQRRGELAARAPRDKILKRVLREPYWTGHTRRIN